MKKPAAVLLDNPDMSTTYRIQIRLQQGRTARMEFNDRDIARAHFDFLRSTGVCGGLAIREIEFIKD
jgi:hypothetical protein